MGSFDTLVLLLLAPASWWLVAMVRAVMNVRDRSVTVPQLDPSLQDVPSHR